MKKRLSLAAVSLLLAVSFASDSTVVLAQLIPVSSITWAFSSGAVEGGNPLDTNVAASSTHVCITTRAGFKCFTKSGTAVSPGMASCDTNTKPIRPVPFEADAHRAETFFSRSCQYVPPKSAKDGRIVFGSSYKRFFMVFQQREGAHTTPHLLIAVSKSEDPRDGWWTYIDQVGGDDNSLDYQFLGVNSSILVVSNKMKLMDADNKWLRMWTDHTMYSAADLASGNASYAKKIWPPYNKDAVCGGCAEEPPFAPYSPSNLPPEPEKTRTAPEFLAAACVHESPTSDFFWIHHDSNLYATVFGRRDGKVTSRRTATLHGGFRPVNGEQMDRTADGKPAPAIIYTNILANYQNCVVRNNTLVAAANIGQKWANNGGVVTNAVRLVRVDVSNFFAASGPLPVVDFIFGKAAPDDPPDQIFHYGWPAVATNANGDIVVGSVRTRETIFPEQRASVWFAGESAIRPSISIHTGPDMTGGTYDMAGAAADPTTSAVYLAQEYTESGKRQVRVTKMLGTNRPDVIPVSISVPLTMVRGTTYSGSMTIVNQGDGAMPAFESTVRLSTDDVIDFLDLDLDTSWNRGLGPGKTAVVPISIAIPRTWAAGRYYVGVQVDSNGDAVEHSEINNANPFLKSGRGNIAVTVQ
jgi:CARDB